MVDTLNEPSRSIYIADKISTLIIGSIEEETQIIARVSYVDASVTKRTRHNIDGSQNAEASSTGGAAHSECAFSNNTDRAGDQKLVNSKVSENIEEEGRRKEIEIGDGGKVISNTSFDSSVNKRRKLLLTQLEGLNTDIADIEKRSRVYSRRQLGFWNRYKASLHRLSNVTDLADARDESMQF